MKTLSGGALLDCFNGSGVFNPPLTFVRLNTALTRLLVTGFLFIPFKLYSNGRKLSQSRLLADFTIEAPQFIRNFSGLVSLENLSDGCGVIHSCSNSPQRIMRIAVMMT